MSVVVHSDFLWRRKSKHFNREVREGKAAKFAEKSESRRRHRRLQSRGAAEHCSTRPGPENPDLHTNRKELIEEHGLEVMAGVIYTYGLP
jgi:hypothetical protein